MVPRPWLPVAAVVAGLSGLLAVALALTEPAPTLAPPPRSTIPVTPGYVWDPPTRAVPTLAVIADEPGNWTWRRYDLDRGCDPALLLSPLCDLPTLVPYAGPPVVGR